MAWKIVDLTPVAQYQFNPGLHSYHQFLLVAMPAAVLVIGWILAYLSTPIRSKSSEKSNSSATP